MCRSSQLLVAGILLAAAFLQPTASAGKEKKPPLIIAARYVDWLMEVQPLITREEREAFLDLTRDYHRDAFIDRFWRARDPFPDTARNEMRERWQERAAQARAWFRTLEDDRARVLLLNGVPDFRCRDVRLPKELWYYDGSDRTPERFNVLFLRRTQNSPYRVWVPGSLREEELLAPGRRATETAQPCPPGTLDRLTRTLRGDTSLSYYASTLNRIFSDPEPPSTEWVLTFASYSTELPEGAETFPAEIEVEYPSRYQSRTVVQALVAVSTEKVARADLVGRESYNFLLIGEVVRDGKLFDSFRYRFDMPVELISSDEIPLVFQRYLRPGDYTLVLKLEDLNSKTFFHRDWPLEVPRVEGAAVNEVTVAESMRMLREANEALGTGDTVVKISEPMGTLQTGLTRFDVRATGREFDRLEFLVDGRRIMTKNSPPYNVELDMGNLPDVRVLRVVAFDESDREVASDELLINASRNRFSVRLIEPRSGKPYRESLQAHAKVQAPDGREVQRVDFYLNEDLLATLFQPPYVQPIVLPQSTDVSYVRAVAYLVDGNSTEDLVFVNAPGQLENVDVHMVELYTTVLDSSGRPVSDLDSAEFKVFEDGSPQTVARFEQVRDRPIHAGILLDTSFSMHERIDEAKRAALKFLEDTITERDRAVIIPFHDQPYVAVKFTNDVGDLAQGLIGIKAERGTALYDSVIYALYYFNGVRGQRTVLVLSDGKDEHSSFTFDDALEYAHRAGVTIYTVGLDIGAGSTRARRQLTQLAEATGGRSFFIKRVDQLDEVYSQVEAELRSQYLVAYQSENRSDSEEFRSVKVEVVRPGLEAKTIQGYYP